MRPGVVRNPATPRALGTRNTSQCLAPIKPGSRYETANRVLINREFRLGPAAEEAVEPGVHLGSVMDVALDVLVARAPVPQAGGKFVHLARIS